jgi:hemerythrin-like domain-containing protein
MHDMHRRASALLATAAAQPFPDPVAVGELRDFLVAHLRHHHESEDTDLWPLIEREAPRTTESLDALSAEHGELESALDALGTAPVSVKAEDRKELVAAATHARDVVHRHLEHEEPVLFPALRMYVTDAEWADFAQKVIETTPPIGAHLLVALLDEVGTSDEVDVVLSALPGPVRELVPAMRAQGRSALDTLRDALSN